ncbi:hypothetical protein [Halomarina rubra]|uniref:Lipoprotein n=1 Tax=Halomarina rubra TaxID=2071873 RepID=A0ABD6AXK2_9EURY|nr:hypothetical protein [Halomarina rubra]
MERRALLASLGVVGTSMLAGCSVSVPFLERTKLGWLSVSNWDETASHTFELRVTRDGTLVHESTHVVKQMEGNTIPGAVADCTWDDVAGEYVVAARVDSDEWREFNLQEATDGSPACVMTTVQYGTYWGIDEADPLNVRVRGGCDQVDRAVGGCPAYNSNTIREPSGDETH